MCLPSPLGLIDLTTWETAQRKHVERGGTLKKQEKRKRIGQFFWFTAGQSGFFSALQLVQL